MKSDLWQKIESFVVYSITAFLVGFFIGNLVFAVNK